MRGEARGRRPRLMQSMSAEQREELMRLSAQAFGSPELMAQLGQLDANLQALRPGEDWSGSERFEGEEGLGLATAPACCRDLAELDELAEQLSQSYNGSRLDDLDLDALARQLGRTRSSPPALWRRSSGPCTTAAFLQRRRRRRPEALPAGHAAAGQIAAAGHRQAALRPAGPPGHPRCRRGGGADRLQPAVGVRRRRTVDVTRTITNAIRRTIADGGDPRHGLRLAVDDIEVTETEARTQAAVALLVDVPFRWPRRGAGCR